MHSLAGLQNTHSLFCVHTDSAAGSHNFLPDSQQLGSQGYLKTRRPSKRVCVVVFALVHVFMHKYVQKCFP